MNTWPTLKYGRDEKGNGARPAMKDNQTRLNMKIVKLNMLPVLLALTAVPFASAEFNPEGRQPPGTLAGKIVFVHPRYGYVAGSSSWNLHRQVLHSMVQDLNNQDAMTFLVENLWNAGATVVPLRPVGHRLEEVIIDNDDPEVEYIGTWSDGSSSVFFGDPGDTPFRIAATSPAETAYARYRPTIPETGRWPVYCWAGHGPDRVGQRYRISHSGGTTEVIVDHRKVGNGLIYLGTFHFHAGVTGFVDVSNRSDETGVVVADMIRFGNGMGDVYRSGPGSVSGQPREDEAAIYWIEAHAGQGIPESEWRVSSDDLSANVTAPSRWAEQMNREASGMMTDRAYLAYSANTADGTARGANGLVHSALPTPNQSALATLICDEIDNDLTALSGSFEHDWYDRPAATFSGFFSEISNQHINDEFDATIINRAFADNQVDAELQRDARVGSLLARATYQGLVRYFNQFDGGATPLEFLPDPVTDFRALSIGDNTITLSWIAPAVDGIGGGAPTGYRVYASLHGRGFDGGTPVDGGSTTSLTISGLDAGNGPHYFRVTATNDAGESRGSPVLAATPCADHSPILIVNGFDRVDRHNNSFQELPSGIYVERVRQRFANSRDYAIQVAEAVEEYDSGLGIDSAENEAVISGDVTLGEYETAIWILGLESVDDRTFDAVEQGLVASHVNNGGNLIVSGSEIAYDLDEAGGGAPFCNDTLHANFITDDAGTGSVQGVAGSIFEGLSLDFDIDGSEVLPVRKPDVVDPLGGAVTALTYVGGSGGGAAIQHEGMAGEGSVVLLAFPFEAILGAGDRAAVMAAMLGFLPMSPGVTVGASLTCLPVSGTVPFNTQMTVNLDNLYTGQSRRIAGRIHVTLAGGNWYPNWRTGWTNVAAGGNFIRSWMQNIPALGSLVGPNLFELAVQDVTPPPFNQPPYPAAGDSATAQCTISGVSP